MDGPDFAVAGIGASAGGLASFRSLFGTLSAETSMAFLVIQHLSPDHPSLLAKTLARLTALPVVEAAEGMHILPGRIYVMPSNVEMRLAEGALHLVPRPASPGGRLPIDALFLSLARELGRRAIGVVLSGTGGDGTQGLEAIKGEGGITFVQDSDTAEFAGMPESAQRAGVVDYVLTPEGIAAELLRLSREPYLRGSPEVEADGGEPAARILAVLRGAQPGIDFAEYKPSTVMRRIARRMALHRMTSLPEYSKLVESDASEAADLSRDMLIHVTGFFRDPEVFEALKRTVFPSLQAKGNAPIRIWVPGCSTGEEVYSLAISLLEYCAAEKREAEFQIFGSDISQQTVQRARTGLYGAAAVADLSPERLQRFFVRTGEEWRIAKSIRDRCVFVVHDLARDPPFARLDLISCRNVLIYFGAVLHERLMPMFHYCLNRPGFLLLGRSETVVSKGLFEPVEQAHRIFVRVGDGGRVAFPLFTGAPSSLALPVAPPHQAVSRPAAEAQRQADHLMLARYAPPGVVINDRLEVIHFRGRTGDFLEQPSGTPQTNLVKMARGPLQLALRRALDEALERNQRVRLEDVIIQRGDRDATIAVEVLPLVPGSGPADRYFLVLFDEAARPQPPLRPVSAGASAAEREVQRLQQELTAARQYLEVTLEHYQAAGDESATVNEELTAANEELQSTNEEMESAKEELQSANEELNTLNDELRGRNLELDQVANDLSNILETVNIPIVIVDASRRLRRYTPGARALLNVIPSDLGRPLNDIKLKLDVPDLDRRVAEVMLRNEPAEYEVRDDSLRWYRMSIRPYVVESRGLDGATISFVDVQGLKQSVREAQAARDYARAVLDSVQVPLLVVDGRFVIASRNRTFERLFGGAPTSGDDLFSSIPGGIGASPALQTALEQALAGDVPAPRVEVKYEPPGAPLQTWAVDVRVVARASGLPQALLSFEDLTEQRRLEEARAARLAAEASNRTKDLFLATLSHELRTPLNTILMQAQALRRASPQAERVERTSGIIERAALLQKRLIDDLLDISRIVSGKLRLDQHVVDLGAVVEGALDEVRPVLEAKGLNLVATLPPALNAVYVDPARMQQIVTNLLSNAIKFTPRGGTIAVKLSREGNAAQVSVSDDGIGIRPEFLPLLFDRFTQADSSATREHGGLGLGLAIVKHLAQMHGGAVGAESAGANRGATFWLRLPLVEEPRLERTPTPVRPAKGTNVAGLRVLVVEDDEGSRESLLEVLASGGAEVRAAPSVQEGLALIDGFVPDVVLSDLNIPGEDGFSLLRRLRALPPEQGGRVPAAALSALASSEDRQRALDAGFHRHLAKPVDIDELLATVAALAEKKPA